MSRGVAVVADGVGLRPVSSSSADRRVTETPPQNPAVYAGPVRGCPGDPLSPYGPPSFCHSPGPLRPACSGAGTHAPTASREYVCRSRGTRRDGDASPSICSRWSPAVDVRAEVRGKSKLVGVLAQGTRPVYGLLRSGRPPAYRG